MGILSYLKRGSAFVFYTLLILLIIFLGSVTGFVIQIKKQLPDLSILREYEPSLITRIYSSTGEPLAYFCLEKRILVSYDSLPMHLIQAIISVEDANFYEHHGLEFEGIIRATLRNLKHRGFVEGGSTITQQLTRSLMLHSEKKIIRKFKEALLALELEKVYSKEKIIEMYLNQIYLGKGSYGVESAARTFFGKHVENLDLSESALLAGLPKAPNHYDPYRHPQRALERRNYVLRRMMEEGFIDVNTFEKTIKIPLNLNRVESETVQAPYFVEYVRRFLEERYGAPTLYRGGLKVYTTLDLDAQKNAEQSLRSGIENLDKRQGFRPLTAEESLQEKTTKDFKGILKSFDETGELPIEQFLGEVLEVSDARAFIRLEDTHYVGILNIEDALWTKVESLDAIIHPDDKIYIRIQEKIKEPEEGPPIGHYRVSLGQKPEVQGAFVALDLKTGYIKAMVGGYDFSTSKYNRAVQARRQPGSAFKPFIYETALKQGYTLANIFIDSPIIYQDELQNKDWKPANYYQKFFGPTTLREALEKSRNVITIKVLKEIGIEETIETVRQMGISSPLAPDLSLALGSSGVSLLELTSAYGIFASGGIRSKSVAILRIEGPDGQILEEHKPQRERVLDEQTAYLMTQALMGVVDHGTGWRAKSLGRHVAGKTGTTNNYVDAWFIGYTPDIVVGVWTGFDEYRSLGDMETGSRAAAPIWVRFMKEYLTYKPIQTFPKPKGINFVPIDQKTGLLATKDCPTIFLEAFKEGSEPKKFCNSHQINNDHFVSIDMDLSKHDQILMHQRSNTITPTNLSYDSD